MPHPSIGLPNPLLSVRSQLQDASVRRAFDQATLDRKTPWEIDANEVDALFDAAGTDNKYVRGDSTTPRELEDLKTIRERGAWLLRTEAAKARFDKKLGALDSLPKVEWSDDDAGLRSRRVAVNRVAIRGTASGFVWCPPNARCIGAPSMVTISLEGRRYAVHPRTGESSASIASRLKAELEKGGYGATVSHSQGASFVTVKAKAEGDVYRYEPMTYGRVKGKVVVNREENPGPDGGAGHDGPWLELDKPLRAGDLEVKKIALRHYGLAAGDEVELNGRIEVHAGPQEIYPPVRFVLLTGVSNLTKGEPRFDGKDFYDELGKKLEVLAYNRPMLMDAPAIIFVLDQGRDTAWRGARGGFIPPNFNPFHGLYGSGKITDPAPEDRAAVTWDAASSAPVKSGTREPLARISRPATELLVLNPHAWYFDGETETAYRFDGDQMAQVFRASRD